MRLLAITAWLIPCLLLAAPAPKSSNLLINGSFEEGPEMSDRFLSLDKGSEVIKGWKVTRGGIDLIGSYWVSSHGKRSLDLHGTPGFGGVEQTFKTKKGSRYRVEFQLASTPSTGKRGVWVEAAGDKKKFEVDCGEATNEKMGWTRVTWEFVATENETTLEIRTTELGDNCTGPAIDDVSVTEK